MRVTEKIVLQNINTKLYATTKWEEIPDGKRSSASCVRLDLICMMYTMKKNFLKEHTLKC